MRPSDVSTLLEKLIPAGYPMLLVGSPGLGKTDLTHQATTRLGYRLLVSHPVVKDPTDFTGLPWPDQGGQSARFLPFGDTAIALNATEPLVWLYDDLGQASAAVQAAAMQLILARRINEHALPDCVTFIACTNRRQDRAGVQGILEPVKSRFTTIVEVDPNVDDWCQWAVGAGFIPPQLIAFMRHEGGSWINSSRHEDGTWLCDLQPSAEMVNRPSPRTWTNLAKLQNLDLPDHLRLPAFAGAVGEVAASRYEVFLAMYKSIVSVDRILTDPMNAPIPDDAGARYAIAAGLAFRANDQTFGRIGQYLSRLEQAGCGEYASYTVKDALRREPDLASNDAYVTLMAGPMGALFTGGVQ